MEFTPTTGPVNTPEFGTVKDEAECRALTKWTELRTFKRA